MPAGRERSGKGRERSIWEFPGERRRRGKACQQARQGISRRDRFCILRCKPRREGKKSNAFLATY